MASEQEMQQHAVSLKLPEFWTSHPRVWFQQTEAQFALRQVTADNPKYFYVVAALDQDSAQRVIDLLEDSPRDHKYLALKERLLDTFDLSDNERAARLLNMPQLGDNKPSVLMDEMLALIADHRPCFLFNYLFLQLLPDDIRMVLSGQQWNDPRQLAARVDELWLARVTAPPVSRILRPRKGAHYGKTSNAVARTKKNCVFIISVSAIKLINVVPHAAIRETRQPVVVNGSDDRHKQGPFLCVGSPKQT